MMTIDWEALVFGFTIGVFVSLFFFAGLAWGMRRALHSTRPIALLLLSSMVRIVTLLAVGFWVTASMGSAWPVAGYALAFFLIRLIAVLRARSADLSAIPKQEDA